MIAILAINDDCTIQDKLYVEPPVLHEPILHDCKQWISDHEIVIRILLVLSLQSLMMAFDTVIQNLADSSEMGLPVSAIPDEYYEIVYLDLIFLVWISILRPLAPIPMARMSLVLSEQNDLTEHE